MLFLRSGPHILICMLAVLARRKSKKSPLPSQRLWVPSVVLGLTALALVACNNTPSPGEAVLKHTIGTNIAALQVQTLEGAPQPLRDLAGGTTPTVLNVWATWCTPCVAELPSLAALGQSGRARVVAIATDASATVVKDFLRQQAWGPGVEVWHDPRGVVTREALSAKALPSTYVLGPSLTIVYAVAGARDWQTKFWEK
jgi:thiol-disulfide isomerase/thioredoxin